MSFENMERKVMKLNILGKEVKEGTTEVVPTSHTEVLNRDNNTLNTLQAQITDVNLVGIDLSFLDESIENLETRTQIKKKTAEIVNLQATEKIANGKLFNEIFELTRYSNKDRESDKCYYDWLKALNLNDRTVLRYRNIAKVFEQVKNPKNKSFIGFLSWEDADFLYKNFKENIDVFGDKEFNSLMEMRAFIKNLRVKQIEEKPKKIFNIEKPDYDRIFVETEEAWNNLDEKTKDKINTYLSKIEELVKSKEIEEAEVVE